MLKTSLSRIAAFALAAPALAALASAQIVPAGQGYLFRAKFVKGDHRKYEMITTMNVGKTKQPVTTPFSLKVLSVEGGNANIRFSMGPFAAGKQKFGAEQSVEASVNALGEVVNSGPTVPQSGLLTFPKNPVKIGEKWKAAVKSIVMDKEATIQGEYTLTGFKTIGGRKTAALTVKLSSDEGLKTRSTGTMYMAVADGSLVKSVMHMVMTFPAKQPKQPSPTYIVDIEIKRK